MPLSSDPRRRRRQLENLRQGGPPAPVGNRRRVTHGAYAVVAGDRLQAKTREVFDALAADAPLREGGELPAADGALVRVLAEALCRLDDVSAYLRDRGWLDGDGNPRTVVLEIEGRLRREVAEYLDAMGMSPRSRARLGLDVTRAAAFDLAGHWADEPETIDATETHDA